MEAGVDDVLIEKEPECREYPTCYKDGFWQMYQIPGQVQNDIHNTNYSGGVAIGAAGCPDGFKFFVHGKSQFDDKVGIGVLPSGDASLEVNNSIKIVEPSNPDRHLKLSPLAFQISDSYNSTLIDFNTLAATLSISSPLGISSITPDNVSTKQVNASIFNVSDHILLNSTKPTKLFTTDDGAFNLTITDGIGYCFNETGFSIFGNGNLFTNKISPEGTSDKITINGKVGIGTIDPGAYKLAVNGKIKTREVVVSVLAWSDYVFEDDYDLKSLEEVEKYIKENKHLPGIPTEKEVKEKGLSVGDMQAKLLEKIEEMTLYIINLKKENKELENRILNVQKKIKQ